MRGFWLAASIQFDRGRLLLNGQQRVMSKVGSMSGCIRTWGRTTARDAAAGAQWLVAEKASPLVNRVKNDRPELLAGLID